MASPRRLGQYEIVELLAEGGMAELYRARSSAAASGAGLRGFERDVAVKRILPHFARDPAFVRMFLDEARIAATLRHPNVISMFEIGVEEDEYFIAMELLEGADLARLRRAVGPIAVEHVLQIGIGACAGLHYAHERCDANGRPIHLIHRDISPQNLFVTVDGAVKLLDFGIAKHAEQKRDTTSRSSIKGKVRYMSPEQCASQPLDRRTDVFSLGIVLWEACAGQKLYVGDGNYQTMRAISEEDAPRLDAVLPGCPRGLSELLAKALMRDRDARFATAEEMQLALEELAMHQKLAVSSVHLGRFVRGCLQGRRDDAVVGHDTAAPEPSAPRRGDPAAIVDEPEASDAPGTRVLSSARRAAPIARIADAPSSASSIRARRPARWPWLIVLATTSAAIVIFAVQLRSAPTSTPAPAPAVTEVTPRAEVSPKPTIAVIADPSKRDDAQPVAAPNKPVARRSDPKPAASARTKANGGKSPPTTGTAQSKPAWDDMSPLPPP